MNKEIVAVQANSLVRANQGTLTLTQKRILLYLIGMIKPEDDGFKYYRVGVSDFAKMLPNKGNNEILSCMSAIDDLEDKKIKIDFGTHITSTRMVLKAKYYVGGGYFDVMLDDELKPLLLNLKEQFTEVYVKHALSLTSVHAVRLYEILKSWESTGSFIAAPQAMREMLGIPDKYPIYSHFKAKVLKPAIAQINKNTDLKITKLDEKRKGRHVAQVTIKFKGPPAIEKKTTSKKVASQSSSQTPHEVLMQRLRDRGVVKPEDLGLSDPAWEKALQKEDPNAPGTFIARTAQGFDSEMKGEEKKAKKNKSQNEIIKRNKDYWEEFGAGYEDVYTSESYVQMGSGEVAKFVEEDFEKKVESAKAPDFDRRVAERRQSKSLIGGSSDARKSPGRRSSD